MNRETRTLLVVGVALVLASVAGVSVYRLLKYMPRQQVEVGTTPAVVASRALSMGTRLSTDDLKLVDWPAKSPIPGGFSTLEALLNRGLISNISQNEPITENKVAPLESGAGLPPTIPPGMRAISVKVNEVIGVAGFVVPGTRVDVIVILRQGTESIARTVVDNVTVLTAGTRYDQEIAKDDKPLPSSVVTLLVAPEDAERIGLAATEGQIMLTLRNPMDVATLDSKGVRTASLMGLTVAPPRPAADRPRAPVKATLEAPPPPPAPPPPYRVEAIRAAKRTEEAIK